MNDSQQQASTTAEDHPASCTINSVQEYRPLTSVERHSLGALLAKMRMKGIAQDVFKLVDSFTKENNIPAAVMIDFFTKLEDIKHNHKVECILKLSNIPQPLLGVNFDESRIQCDDAEEHLSLEWLDRKQNLFMTGTHGLGKTQLAVHIARKAIREKEYSVFFAQSTDFMSTVHSDETGRLLKRACKTKVLILDDVGDEDLRLGNTRLFKRLLTYRMNKGLSTIITTAVPVSTWAKCFDAPLEFSDLMKQFFATTKKINFTGVNFYEEQARLLNSK